MRLRSREPSEAARCRTGGWRRGGRRRRNEKTERRMRRKRERSERSAESGRRDGVCVGQRGRVYLSCSMSLSLLVNGEARVESDRSRPIVQLPPKPDTEKILPSSPKCRALWLSPPVHGPPSSIQKRVLEGRGAREWGVRLLGRVKPRRSLASGGDTRRMSPRESGASETLGWSREPKERNAGWREGTCEIEGGRCGAARVSKGDE